MRLRLPGRLAFVLGLLPGLLMGGCSEPEPPAPAAFDRHFAAGIEELHQGLFRPARARFRQLADSPDLSGDPLCRAEYAYALAIAFEFVGALLDASDWNGNVNGNSIGGDLSILAAATPTDEIDSYVSSFLDAAIQAEIEPLLQALDRLLLLGGCEVSVAGGIPLETAARTWVRLGSRFDTEHARLLRAAMRALRGAAMWLSAWDMRIDFAQIIEIVQASSDDDGLLFNRAFARAVSDSSGFLTLHSGRGFRLPLAVVDLRAAIADLRAGIAGVFDRGGGPEGRQSVFAWVDRDGNGRMSRGDELWLGILAAEPKLEVFGQVIHSYPINLADGDLGGFVGTLVFSLVESGWLRELDRLLGRVSDNLAGNGPLLNLAEFNALLPIELIPGLVALDLARLFPNRIEDVVPLRALLPAWGQWSPPGGGVDYPGRYTTFLIEEEVGAGRPQAWLFETAEAASDPVWCVVCPPGPRFAEARYGAVAGRFRLMSEVVARTGVTVPTEIPDDCVDPGSGGRFGYAWWQDPSFAGALHINLAGLSSRDACPADATWRGGDWGSRPVPRGQGIPASRYSLGKLLALTLGQLPGPDDLF